jgi:ATP-dependent DNA helicase RecQ
VAAAQLDSSLSPTDRFCTEVDLREGNIRLLFVAPERLVASDFCSLLRNVVVRAFAIDEAHCISHWGHDFRPEYRQLNRLKELFPKASVHAFTATATQRVREDICKQLALRTPDVLVGDFDRPNLNYRVLPRHDLTRQIMDVLERHTGEAGIIYCIRRRDVDDVAALLKGRGLNVLPYHAGMDADERRRVQDAFASESCDIIVATVAFGMGIDRSNIRFILHAAMPKSIEHYQQETGRGGRDGLEAECVLLYSGADYRTWDFVLRKSFEENQADPAQLAAALQHVRDMENYCRAALCRHRALVQHFGQKYDKESCGACDLCLGDTEAVPDALVVAQKILSCVARVKEKFGVGHIVSVLRGENNEKVHRFGHDQLSTFGLLKEMSQPELRQLVFQLINQDVLAQQDVALASGQTVQVLVLNPASWEVMKGKRDVRLHRLVKKSKAEMRRSTADHESWEGVERSLFEELRILRRQLAEQREVHAFVIFSDRTLRDLARVRPSTLERMRQIYGIGETKLQSFGDLFLTAIATYCRTHGTAQDVAIAASAPAPRAPSTSPTKALALEMFANGATMEQVMQKTGRTRSTVLEYLCEFIRQNTPEDVTRWITMELYERIAAAARQVGMKLLRPIFVQLEEKVAYDDIRIVVTHLTAQAGALRKP